MLSQAPSMQHFLKFLVVRVETLFQLDWLAVLVSRTTRVENYFVSSLFLKICGCFALRFRVPIHWDISYLNYSHTVTLYSLLSNNISVLNCYFSVHIGWLVILFAWRVIVEVFETRNEKNPKQLELLGWKVESWIQAIGSDVGSSSCARLSGRSGTQHRDCGAGGDRGLDPPQITKETNICYMCPSGISWVPQGLPGAVIYFTYVILFYFTFYYSSKIVFNY